MHSGRTANAPLPASVVAVQDHYRMQPSGASETEKVDLLPPLYDNGFALWALAEGW
jgi:hypothetical protein